MNNEIETSDDEKVINGKFSENVGNAAKHSAEALGDVAGMGKSLLSEGMKLISTGSGCGRRLGKDTANVAKKGICGIFDTFKNTVKGIADGLTSKIRPE